MINLDDADALRAADPRGMLDAVAGLPGHCREGYAAGRDAHDLPSADGLTAMTFCGMGGSAVAGDVLRVLYRERLRVPVEVVRGPSLPAYCGPQTLVLCSSYSGNTAETLSCFEEAVKRGCRNVCITSGGELRLRAGEEGAAIVPIPPGFQPRAALGYLAPGALGALESVGLLPGMEDELAQAAAELSLLAARLGPANPRPDNEAKELAVMIRDRTPVIWGADGRGSVAAMRWKTQMNENAKRPAFWSALPELDHNEVVGWAGRSGAPYFLIVLRHEGENPDVAARFPASIQIAEEAGMVVEEVWAAGRAPLGQLLTLVMMGDFTSVYLALDRGVDPSPVEVIDRLKRALEES